MKKTVKDISVNPDTAATAGRAKAPAKHKSASKSRAAEPVAETIPTAETTPVAQPSPVVEAVAEATPETVVTREHIARLAYSYWEARGYQGGSETEDWLRAEAELRGRAR